MKTITMMLLLLDLNGIRANAQEGNNKHQYYIDIGLTAGSYSKSIMGGAYGAVGIYFNSFAKQSAIDIRSKEHYVQSPQLQVGALSLTYRIFFTKGFYTGLGGAHNHGIAFNHFEKDPIGSLFATNQNIFHRTGLIVEVGYDFRSFIRKGRFGIYPVTNVSYTYMPGYGNPIPLLNFSLGFRFGFKRMENNE